MANINNLKEKLERLNLKGYELIILDTSEKIEVINSATEPQDFLKNLYQLQSQAQYLEKDQKLDNLTDKFNFKINWEQVSLDARAYQLQLEKKLGLSKEATIEEIVNKEEFIKEIIHELSLNAQDYLLFVDYDGQTMKLDYRGNLNLLIQKLTFWGSKRFRINLQSISETFNTIKDELPKAKLLKIFTTPKGDNIIAYKLPRKNKMDFWGDLPERKYQQQFLQTAQEQTSNFNKTWITLFIQTATTNYLATTYEKGQIAIKILDMFEALVISTDQIDKFHFPLDFANQSLDHLEELINNFQQASGYDPSKWIMFDDAMKKIVALDNCCTEEDKNSLIYKKQSGIEGVLSAGELPILTEIDFKMFGGSHLLKSENAANFAQIFFEYLLTLLELYPEAQKEIFECVPVIRSAIMEKYDHSDHDDFPF